MVQGAPQVAGRFDAEIRMYKAPPPEVTSEQFYETDLTKPYQRGFALQNVSPLPITYAEHVSAQGHWGGVLREYMRDYNHWAVLGALCEFLPRWDNSVTLADERDRNGLPVTNFSYSLCDNDRAFEDAAQRVQEDILRAAGATETMAIKRYAHLVGGCRMATDEAHGVVNADHADLCRTEPLPGRRERDPHSGLGQPGPDHHGSRRSLRRSAAGPSPTWSGHEFRGSRAMSSSRDLTRSRGEMIV